MSNFFDTVTVEEFKDYFFRDFPYLPIWNPVTTYWKDDVVFYEDNFYKSLSDNKIDMTPDVSSVWLKIKGDKYAYITDEDISKAMTQALPNANERFGETCVEKKNIYLHLVAFYLVFDIKNSSTGINSSYLGAVASKSVDGVSESFSIPNWLLNSPLYSIYSQNGYGLKYLSLIAPYTAVTVLFAPGNSTIG